MSSSEYNTRMLAKETNKMNYKIFQEQQKYNWDVMNAQNEYNSAVQQRQRLENAGMNPYMMMDGGSAGSASSSIGVNPPTMQAPQTSGYDDIQSGLNTLSNTLSSAAENVKTLNEANGVQIENQYKANKMVAETNNFIADTAKKAQETKSESKKTYFQELANQYQKFVNDHQETSWFNEQNLNIAQKELFSAQASKEIANAAWIDTQNELSKKELEYYDINQLQQYQERAANIALLSAQKGYTEEQTRLAVKQGILVEAQKDGVLINNSLAQRLADPTVKEAKQRLANSRTEGDILKNEKSSSSTLNDPLSTFYMRLANTVFSPIKGIFSGGMTKTFK